MHCRVLILLLFLFCGIPALVRGNISIPDSTERLKTEGYQIHLKQPAKEIKLLLYEKNYLPVKGELSIDRLSIIMRNYEMGSKVRVKVIYEDGTEEEFVRSSCYIDPVIL